MTAVTTLAALSDHTPSQHTPSQHTSSQHTLCNQQLLQLSVGGHGGGLAASTDELPAHKHPRDGASSCHGLQDVLYHATIASEVELHAKDKQWDVCCIASKYMSTILQ